jgi:hypothetical protein
VPCRLVSVKRAADKDPLRGQWSMVNGGSWRRGLLWRARFALEGAMFNESEGGEFEVKLLRELANDAGDADELAG